MGAPRIGSKTSTPRSARHGFVNGRTAEWGEPSGNVVESQPLSTTVGGTNPPAKSTSSEATESAANTTKSSVPPTASFLPAASLLVKDFYADPNPVVTLRPEHAVEVDKLAFGYGINRDLMLRRIVTRLLAAGGNWANRTVDELVQFYLDNVVIH